tara:strand:- start:1741 stop:3045 length:1305 start_codon:yes stop_codon:yes gene_type:complete
MTFSVYNKNNKCLVFPTMCDAHILIDYEKHNGEVNTGLWATEGAFTCQFVITPYDVNGYGDNTGETQVNLTDNGGAGNNSNRKTMPAVADNVSALEDNQDQKYLPNAQRYDHKMCLFHNTNLNVSLVNTTTYNQNNPAEYRIEFSLRINGTTTHLISPTVFTSRKYHYQDMSSVVSNTAESGSSITLWDNYHEQFLYKGFKIIGREAGQKKFYHSGGGYYEGYTLKYTPSSTPTTGYDIPANTVALVINDPIPTDAPTPQNAIPIGCELFNDEGVSLGTVHAHLPKGTLGSTHHKIVMNPLPEGATIPTFTDGAKFYVPVHREPMYIQTSAHVAVGYEEATRRMSIFYNGVEVASGTHGATSGKFSFDESDIYIGKNASLSYPDDRKTQYMGEMNYIVFTDEYTNTFTSLFNPIAPKESIKLYYDFNEGRKLNE